MPGAELTLAEELVLARRPVPVKSGFWLPAFSLWQRELVRFYRQRSRVIGVIGSPLIFWLVVGSGFGASFRAGGREQGYLEYFFPGTIVLTLLFTSIFCMMSVIEDRREGFLLSVLVSPISRASLVMGKVLGGATLAVIQSLLLAALAPFIGIRLGVEQVLLLVLALFLAAFALTALGFLIAWRLDSTHGFSCADQSLSDPDVVAFWRALSDFWRTDLDRMGDEAQPADVQRGCRARRGFTWGIQRRSRCRNSASRSRSRRLLV